MARRTQVAFHFLSTAAEGTKEDIDFHVGSGTASAAWLFRSGARGTPLERDYGNVNWSDGAWAADGTQGSWTLMSDHEDGARMDSRNAHTLRGLAIRTQRSTGAGNPDIDEIYDITDAKVDALEINNLVNLSGDECNSALVPFTSGVSSSTVVEVLLPTGVGTVTIPLTERADLLKVGSVSRTVAPSTDDVTTDANVYGEPALWSTGLALRIGNKQRCMTYHELHDLTGPATTDASFQIRDDSVMAKATELTLDFTVSVTDWEAGSGTDVELTTTSGAAGEYLIVHAMTFDDPTNIVLIDTEIPAAGDWVETGIGFEPETVIAYNAMNVTTLNTLTEARMSLSAIVFDEIACYTSSLNANFGQAVAGGTGGCSFHEDIVLKAKNDVPTLYVEAEFAQPVMTSSGFTATQVTSPATAIKGFLLAFGIPNTDVEGAINITKPSFIADNGTILPYQGPGNFPGKLRIVASRTHCLSGGTITFSAKTTTLNGHDEHEVIGTGGTSNIAYYWDFGVSNAGNYDQFYGGDKNINVGGFAGIMTFHAPDGSGILTRTVTCRCEDTSGNWAVASMKITVQALDDYFSAANTLVFSKAESADNDWENRGYDIVPPAGYVQHDTLASAFTNGQMASITGKRLMFKNDEDWSAETNIYIRSGCTDFHIGRWGNELSGNTVVESGSNISFAAPATGPQLAFDAGTAAFVIGEVVTGTNSTHSGTVRMIVKNSGDWGTSDAKGQMDLDGATGIFQDDEPLTGSISGVAVADGTTTTVNVDKNLGIGGTITHPAGAFAALSEKAEIDITGAAGNNRRWTLRTISSTTSTVKYNSGIVMTTEAANGAAVITERSLRPELAKIVVGVKDEGETSNIMDDANLAQAKLDFSNDGMCENGYFNGLRTPAIDYGFCVRQMTSHDIDLDYEDEPVGIGDNGRIILPAVSAALWTSKVLDPNSCPFPWGIYLSGCKMIASKAEILANGTPGTNITGVAFSHVLWLGIVDCYARSAREMGLRLQGYENLCIYGLDLGGQVIGGSGPKGNLIQRSDGANRVSELTATSVRGTYRGADDPVDLSPHSRWSCVQNVYASNGDIGNGGLNEIGASTDGVRELHEDCLWNAITFDTAASQFPPSVQVAIETGINVCVCNITGLQNTGLADDSVNSTLNDGPNNQIINFAISTVEGYLGPNYLNSVGGSEFNLPDVSASPPIPRP